MSSMSEVLSREALALLQQYQLAGTVDGKHRRLRRGVFRHSSDEAMWTEEIEIPLYLDSIESLRFIGLKGDAASQVLQNYRSANGFSTHGHPPSRDQAEDMITFATGYLESRGDAVYPNEDWMAALKKMGIRRSTRQAICDPKFDDIRFTNSAKGWAKETLKDGWSFLCAANTKVQQDRKHLQQEYNARHSGNRKSQASDIPAPKSENLDPQIPITLTEKDIPKQKEIATMFYKGGVCTRFERSITPDSAQLDINKLLSTPPGDFSARTAVLYLNKQRQVAYHYANYAKGRTPAADCGILYISIPAECINGVGYVYGEEWLDLVFASRSGRLSEANIKIGALWSESSWLVGACCSQSNEQVGRMSHKQELQVLKIGGEKAQQWVVMKEIDQLRIAMACKDRVWVELTHPKPVELKD